MKALTIIQPYAKLLCLPEGDPHKKLVENRTWSAPWWLIGKPLAIHAGKAKRYQGESVLEISEMYSIAYSQLAFGAVIGIGILEGCLEFDQVRLGRCGRWPWIAGHPHANGPFCWVLPKVIALSSPVTIDGSRGLWDWEPNDEAIELIMEGRP